MAELTRDYPAEEKVQPLDRDRDVFRDASPFPSIDSDSSPAKVIESGEVSPP
jgi:hypothetical protein